MNVFFGVEDSGAPPVLIDFQWTGCGLGMLDLAMHLFHSVSFSAMDGGGEEQLFLLYHSELTKRLRPEAAARYTLAVARRHYALCLVDYSRIIFSRFWNGKTPEAFEKNAMNMNSTMLTRDIQCVLRFVDRVDKCLALLEEERSGGFDPVQWEQWR